MQDRRNIISRKAAAAMHYTLWYYLSKMIKPVLVAEYPKSGGTWYCQMLSDYLDLPYPRNRMPVFKKSVSHSHYIYNPSFFKPHCIVRDGRDIMVSYYHHMYFGNNVLPEWVFEYYRTRAPFTDFDNIEKNMPAYIEYMFTKHIMSGKIVTWKSFLQSYSEKPDVVFVKYEDLLDKPLDTLSKSIYDITGSQPNTEKLQQVIEKYSFKNITKRRPGEENKKEFLRKGIAGDWKNYFTKEASDLFEFYAGDMLRIFNY